MADLEVDSEASAEVLSEAEEQAAAGKRYLRSVTTQVLSKE